jgi:hypothetical protein
LLGERITAASTRAQRVNFVARRGARSRPKSSIGSCRARRAYGLIKNLSTRRSATRSRHRSVRAGRTARPHDRRPRRGSAHSSASVRHVSGARAAPPEPSTVHVQQSGRSHRATSRRIARDAISGSIGARILTRTCSPGSRDDFRRRWLYAGHSPDLTWRLRHEDDRRLRPDLRARPRGAASVLQCLHASGSTVCREAGQLARLHVPLPRLGVRCRQRQAARPGHEERLSGRIQRRRHLRSQRVPRLESYATFAS